MQEKVDGEIDKLIKQGHIERLEDCSDKFFLSPIVITVKKDGSVKLSLKARELNKQVHKNQYQMPNNEELMEAVGQTISKKNAYISYQSAGEKNLFKSNRQSNLSVNNQSINSLAQISTNQN